MAESNLPNIVGINIRTLRRNKGLTQEALAEKAGLHYSYIGGIERGERNISLETIQKIVQALEAHPSDLFEADLDYPNETIDKELYQSYKTILRNRDQNELEIIFLVSKEELRRQSFNS